MRDAFRLVIHSSRCSAKEQFDTTSVSDRRRQNRRARFPVTDLLLSVKAGASTTMSSIAPVAVHTRTKYSNLLASLQSGRLEYLYRRELPITAPPLARDMGTGFLYLRF